MRRFIVAVCALVTLRLALPAAMANPIPVREIPGLRDAIRYAVEHGQQQDCGDLPERFARVREGSLDMKTLDLICKNMRVLEPCIVEAQRMADRLESTLHWKFRENASAEGKASMCAILRERLIELGAERGELRWPATRLMELADMLSVYRDQATSPVLSALIEELQGSLADELSADQAEVREEPTVSAFLIRARRRIDNPATGPIMGRGVDGRRRFQRSASEVVECRLRRESPVHGGWNCLSIEPGTLESYFGYLESSPLARGYVLPSDHLANLRICFRDGFCATMIACSRGRVYYDDDYPDWSGLVLLRSPELADAILALADSLLAGPPLER
jgi:hypothetical protein